MTLEVLSPGPLATVQDLGRPGLAHLGVGESGAGRYGSSAANSASRVGAPTTSDVHMYPSQ